MTEPHAGKHPPPISDYVQKGGVDDLRQILSEFKMGEAASAPSKPDTWKWISAAAAVIGLIVTIWTAAGNVVESNKTVAASNQKLIDRVESIDYRLSIVEKGRAENLPRIDGEIAKASSENKMQSDRIQSAAEALADERRARNEDNAATRKAQSDIMALISKLADKIAEIDKSVAVMQAPGRRSDSGPRQQPQRDAFNPALP